MAVPKSHINLIVYCLTSIANAIGFGFFYGSSSTFADYYNVTQDYINNTFYIGLIAQIVFCIPAIKVIQWRLDYSIIAGSFLTCTSYWIQVVAQESFYVVVAAICLLGLGQSLILPLSPFFAEKWYKLEQRSFVIALGFYSNIFGLTFGGILTALYIGDDVSYINSEIFIISLISTVIFGLTILFIRNPRKKIQKYKQSSLLQVKLLWRQKFNTYSVIMASTFLGVSWNFLSSSSIFLGIFSPLEVGILLVVWIVSGTCFGIVVAYIVGEITAKKGTSWWNDIIFKFVMTLSLIGYGIMGMIYCLNLMSYWVYVLVVILLGIGNLGFFGLVFLSFIETLYPINSLIIGTIIAVAASFYSTLITALSDLYFINVFYVMGLSLILPWVFVVIVYQTNLKRYKYYLNQVKAKYQFLKVETEDYKTQ